MKLWPVAFFIPIFAFAFSSTPESSCRDIFELPHESLGINRDQGKISWCYAFTAADMLQYTFHQREQISAADLAINYNRSAVGRIMDTFTNFGNPHETGFNKAALILGMRDGYCPESVFPSEKWVKVIDKNESVIPMKEAMNEIQELHKRRHEINEHNLPYYFKFKNVDKKKFLELLHTKNLRTFYNNLRLTACQDDRKPFGERWKVKMVLRHSGIFNRINEQLDLGRIVGLDYDARILENKDHRGVKLTELHTSSIVGRRWNRDKNICEYRIRDSHGVQCSRYDREYECQQGNIWLSESQIYGSMTSVVYMLAP